MAVKIARVLTACAFALSFAAPAFAHGETQTSDPEDGAVLRRAPKKVTFTLSETPTADSELIVTDGCKRNVASNVTVDGNVLASTIGRAQPGWWTMRFRAVSAEDGHLTKDSVKFTVKGRKECNPDKGNGKKGNRPGRNQAAPRGDRGDKEGSDFPLVPVVLGTLGLIVVAVIVRRSAAS